MTYRRDPTGGKQRTSSGIHRSFTPTTRHRPRPRRMNNRWGHRRVNRRVAGRDPDGGKRRISIGIHPSNTPTTWRRPRPQPNPRRSNSPPTCAPPRPNNAHPAGRLSHKPDPPTGRPLGLGTPAPQPWWRRKAIVIPAALLTVAVIAAAIVITSQQQQNSNGPQTAARPTTNAPSGNRATRIRSSSHAAVHRPQLPRRCGGGHRRRPLRHRLWQQSGAEAGGGLEHPDGAAVHRPRAPTVWRWMPPATSTSPTVDNNRVLKLAAGSATQTVLPFTGLNSPAGVAVDAAGNLYVTDEGNNRVLKLAAGSATQSVLPFTGLNGPGGVAVDAAGNLYVTDSANNRVLKLAAGSSHPDRAAVHRPQLPRGCGGGHRRQPLRHRQWQQSGGETGGGLGHPERAAVHRPHTPAVWRWMPPATSTSPTWATVGW